MTDATVIALLERLVGAVEGLRADLRRQRADGNLEAAWREEVGSAPMTTARLLRWIEDGPHDPVAVAVAGLIDLEAPGRAVSLGRLLAQQRWLESEPRSGVLMYRLRGD